MKDIKELLARAAGGRAKAIEERRIVSEAIKKAAGPDIPVEKIGFGIGKVRLSGLSQMTRSAIFIKKTAILRALEERLPARRIMDIS